MFLQVSVIRLTVGGLSGRPPAKEAPLPRRPPHLPRRSPTCQGDPPPAKETPQGEPPCQGDPPEGDPPEGDPLEGEPPAKETPPPTEHAGRYGQ